MEKTYENAIKIIESRQRRSRPLATAPDPAASVASSSGTPGLRGTPGIQGMSEWLEMLGYSQHDLTSLNIIHVAGTKGKGSTSAFVASLLRAHGQRTGFPRKIGLYTSPHLISPTERIRLNGLPIPKDDLAKYLFELTTHLPQLAQKYDPSQPLLDRGPRYLQLFALLAFHVFLREGVDAAIIETHSGGEYDATNVIQHPVVAAITTLGLDHIDMLGPTLANIAWHKAGIFKKGAAALSTVQDAGLEAVLRQRAEEKGALPLQVVDEDPRLPTPAQQLPQLTPHVQRQNASLALAAADAWLPATSALSPRDIHTGITTWTWPGRFQTLPDPTTPRLTWHLDAAHNDLSVRLAAEWFASITTASLPARNVLLFTHINALRDAEALLRTLARCLRQAGAEMATAVFTTYAACEAEGMEVPGSWDGIWREVFPGSGVEERVGIAGAVEAVRGLVGDGEREVRVLVTGSQHLVGPVLGMLEGALGADGEG